MKDAFSAQYGCIDQYLITWEHFKWPSLRKSYTPKMNAIQKEDKSSDIEQQPPFGDRKYSNTLPQKRGVQNQREHTNYTKFKTWRFI